MKILVTGSEGFIGSYLMDLLPDAIGYDLKSGQDIRDKEQLNSYMKGVDVVVHLAAQTSIAHAWDDPTDYYSHNILGTSNVIEIAIKNKVKQVIFASSSSVYQPYDNPYSFSKFACEKMFELRKDKLNALAFRFMNVYGKGQNPNYGTIIPAFYKGIKNGTGIQIYGDGTHTRDYVHVSDVADILRQATASTTKGLEIMDLGTGQSWSVLDVAKQMFSLTGKSVQINFLPERPEVKISKAKMKNIRKRFDFDPIRFDEGLRLVIKNGI